VWAIGAGLVACRSGELLLCAVADRGLGKAAASVREFAALRNEGGSVLIDLLEGWVSGAVSTSGLHSLIIQLRRPGVTVVTSAHSRHYGAPRDHTAAVRIVTVPGDALRAIVAELQGATPHEADAALARSAALRPDENYNGLGFYVG
jgi:hypothetical protein